MKAAKPVKKKKKKPKVKSEVPVSPNEFFSIFGKDGRLKQLPPPSLGLPKPKQIKTEPVDDQLMVQGIEPSGPENSHNYNSMRNSTRIF